MKKEPATEQVQLAEQSTKTYDVSDILGKIGASAVAEFSSGVLRQQHS